MKKHLTIIMIGVLFLFAVIVSACGTTGTTSGAAGTGNTVHMRDDQFVQQTITIKKGTSLQLVNDAGVPHIIANGTWSNGNAQPKQEGGAPTINNVQVAGGASQTVGPFNTAGTFQLYCTVHPGMNLTVVVQ